MDVLSHVLGIPKIGGGGGVVTPTYADKVLSIESESLVAYWQLNELEGSVALDSSENERHGVYTGVALDSADGAGVTMGRAGLWDAGDYCNVYSASLASAFNPSEGTAAIWFKVSGVDVWTDSTLRRLFHLRVDTNNVVRIERATTNNRIAVTYVAGGMAKQTNINGLSSTDWVHVALTWSVTNDEVKAYLNGEQQGATLTDLGTWAGTLSSTLCALGATDTSGNGAWSGYLHHAALWSKALTDAKVALLADPSPLVSSGGDIIGDIMGDTI